MFQFLISWRLGQLDITVRHPVELLLHVCKGQWRLRSSYVYFTMDQICLYIVNSEQASRAEALEVTISFLGGCSGVHDSSCRLGGGWSYS